MTRDIEGNVMEKDEPNRDYSLACNHCGSVITVEGSNEDPDCPYCGERMKGDPEDFTGNDFPDEHFDFDETKSYK